jgi:hypothetical protein
MVLVRTPGVATVGEASGRFVAKTLAPSLGDLRNGSLLSVRATRESTNKGTDPAPVGHV